MKKLITKTALVTLCSILLLLSLLYGVFAIFFPKPLANAFWDMGSYHSAVVFYEKQYNKTQSLDDLHTLCVKLDAHKDSERVVEYASKFVGHEKFSTTCEGKDIEGGVSSEDIIEGKFVCAYYLETKDIYTTVERAKSFVKNKYSEYNPFYMLYTDSELNLTATQLNEIIKGINSAKASLPSAQKTIAQADIDAINAMLGN